MKERVLGAGEMAQQLRAVDALAGDLASIPVQTGWLIKTVTPVPGDLSPSSSSQLLHTCGARTHMNMGGLD